MNKLAFNCTLTKGQLPWGDALTRCRHTTEERQTEAPESAPYQHRHTTTERQRLFIFVISVMSGGNTSRLAAGMTRCHPDSVQQNCPSSDLSQRFMVDLHFFLLWMRFIPFHSSNRVFSGCYSCYCWWWRWWRFYGLTEIRNVAVVVEGEEEVIATMIVVLECGRAIVTAMVVAVDVGAVGQGWVVGGLLFIIQRGHENGGIMQKVYKDTA